MSQCNQISCNISYLLSQPLTLSHFSDVCLFILVLSTYPCNGIKWCMSPFASASFQLTWCFWDHRSYFLPQSSSWMESQFVLIHSPVDGPLHCLLLGSTVSRDAMNRHGPMFLWTRACILTLWEEQWAEIVCIASWTFLYCTHIRTSHHILSCPPLLCFRSQLGPSSSKKPTSLKSLLQFRMS